MSEPYYDSATYAVRNSVGYLIKRAHSLCLDALEPGLASLDLTYVQFGVLMAVRDEIALTPRDLCWTLRHDSGAMTRVLDQLETRGLIERRRSAEDRRAVDVQLTAAGLAKVEEVVPLVVDRLNGALAEFTHAEVEELLRLLIKLVGHMQREAAPASTP
jgi:DNA-binding MarR family transcriptional regulator